MSRPQADWDTHDEPKRLEGTVQLVGDLDYYYAVSSFPLRSLPLLRVWVLLYYMDLKMKKKVSFINSDRPL